MRKILLVVLLAAGPVFATATPAGACHPDPVELGCPHGCYEGHGWCCPPLPEALCGFAR